MIEVSQTTRFWDSQQEARKSGLTPVITLGRYAYEFSKGDRKVLVAEVLADQYKIKLNGEWHVTVAGGKPETFDSLEQASQRAYELLGDDKISPA